MIRKLLLICALVLPLSMSNAQVTFNNFKYSDLSLGGSAVVGDKNRDQLRNVLDALLPAPETAAGANFTDGETISGTTYFFSSSAAFVSGDATKTIVGTDIASTNTTIASVPTTTVSVASNGLALPQATVYVASTSGYYSGPGKFIVTISAAPVIINYTGKVAGAALLTTVGTDVTANTFTKNAHGLANGTVVIPTGMVSTTAVTNGTPYYVVNTAANTFQVSATAGGSAIDLTGTNDSAVVTISSAPAFTGCTGGTGTLATSQVVGGGQVVLSANDTATGTGLTFSVLGRNTTVTLDYSKAAAFYTIMTGNRSVTMKGHSPGQTVRYFVKQDNSGSHTITWPSDVMWSGGSAPTLTTAGNKTDLITFEDTGTKWLGRSTLNY